METLLSKGTLTTWKDDRGFGFIKPDDGGKDVFLHISALKRAGRRPKVGDIILYERLTEPNGNVSAAKASIQGVASRPFSTKQKPAKPTLRETVFGLGSLISMALLIIRFASSYSPSPIQSITQPGYSSSPIQSITQPECIIKGNISINTGSKLYHLPGMEDYESTIIAPAKGERWFCTESEAIQNGWSKAPR